MFDAICYAIRKELDKLDEKYDDDVQMSAADLKDIDTMAHALKNLATYKAMEDGYRRDSRRDYRRY